MPEDMTNEQIQEMREKWKSISYLFGDEPKFDIVSNDTMLRLSPGNQLRLNTNANWLVSPTCRSRMHAIIAAKYYSEAMTTILSLLDEIERLKSQEVNSKA